MNNKRAAIYVRVSTDAQREEGYSIDAQTEMLTAYCVSKGIKEYDYYIDGGFSGSNIDRPEMFRLIEDVKRGVIDTVLVYRLDRLSRSQKDTLYLIEDVFNPHGVDFISLNESMDTSTPLGRLMLGILSAFAQLERENIRERTRMGMKERVKSGLWMGGGHVPYGYDYDKDKGILVPNQDAETVRKMYDLYLAGNSCSSISRMFGLKYEKLVIQILTRKSNAGFIVYNGEEYKGQHEAIISLDIYNRTMAYMQERSVKRVSESNYLLTGLLHCGKCGAKMRYQKWGKRDCKIVCYSLDKNKPHLIKDPNCSNDKHWASDIENIVVSDLFAFAVKQKATVDESASSQSMLDVLDLQYLEVSKKIKRLYNLYADNADEILLETIEERQKQLLSIQHQIERERETSVLASNTTAIKKTLSTLEETWEYMSIRERKHLIQGCVDRVVITGNNIEVYYKFDDFQKASGL